MGKIISSGHRNLHSQFVQELTNVDFWGVYTLKDPSYEIMNYHTNLQGFDTKIPNGTQKTLKVSVIIHNFI